MTSVIARMSGKPVSACGSGRAPLGRMDSAHSISVHLTWDLMGATSRYESTGLPCSGGRRQFLAKAAEHGFGFGDHGLHDVADGSERADGAGALARWIALAVWIDPGRGLVSA